MTAKLSHQQLLELEKSVLEVFVKYDRLFGQHEDKTLPIAHPKNKEVFNEHPTAEEKQALFSELQNVCAAFGVTYSEFRAEKNERDNRRVDKEMAEVHRLFLAKDLASKKICQSCHDDSNAQFVFCKRCGMRYCLHNTKTAFGDVVCLDCYKAMFAVGAKSANMSAKV